MIDERLPCIEYYERERWAEYAGMNIETGVMQLVRAVALPT